MPDAVTNIQDVQRPRKQGRRFGRRGGDSEGFHGRGHCRLGRRGSWTGEHSTQRTQAEQRLSRAWPGPAGESGVEGPACTQADGSRLALHRGPGAGQGARQGRNERPAEDPTEDCGGVQRRSEAARARGTGECAPWPQAGPGQLPLPRCLSPHPAASSAGSACPANHWAPSRQKPDPAGLWVLRPGQGVSRPTHCACESTGEGQEPRGRRGRGWQGQHRASVTMPEPEATPWDTAEEERRWLSSGPAGHSGPGAGRRLPHAGAHEAIEGRGLTRHGRAPAARGAGGPHLRVAPPALVRPHAGLGPPHTE